MLVIHSLSRRETLQRFVYKKGAEPHSVFLSAPVTAATFIRKMRGHSEAMLLRGTDGGLYVVKPRANPAAASGIANELIGASLCQAVGLSVPQSYLVQVGEEFLDHHPDAWFKTRKGGVRPPAGLHYGTAFEGRVEGPGRPFEILHGSAVNAVRNRDDFCGIYLFDIWANHLDRRQCLYLRDGDRNDIQAVFLDNGMLFGGNAWHMSDPSSQTQYRKRDAENVLWATASVNTWIERFRDVIPGALAHSLKLVPPEWCAGDLGSLEQTLMWRLSSLEQIVSSYALETVRYFKSV